MSHLKSIRDTSTGGSESTQILCESGHIGAINLRNNGSAAISTLTISTAESGVGPLGEMVFDQAIAEANGVLSRQIIFDPPLSLDGFTWLSYSASTTGGAFHVQIYEYVF